MNRYFSALLLVPILAVSVDAAEAQALQQSAAAEDHLTTTGTVVSETRTTLVVRTDADEYRLFELTSDTTRPSTIRVGSTVAVTAAAGENPSAPLASRVLVTAQPAAPADGAAASGPPAAAPASAADEPIPPSIRQLERDIQRQTSRYRIGARTGVALAPELIVLGVQSQLGPFFNENVWARPNIELGFGELSTMIALNFEGIYRLPVRARTGRWQTFFGAGFGLNFINKSLSGEVDGDRFDFGDFVFDSGLNLLAGVQTREGPFFELRAGAYSEPTLRFVAGYNF